jgi:hypothetical protein
MGNSTSYGMDNEGLCEHGDQHTKNHLVPLTPDKEIRDCHDCGCTSINASVRDGLGWRLRSVVQEAIHILTFDISQNLSFPTREVAVVEFDIQVVVHVGDNEDNIGRGLFQGVSW